MEQAMTKQLVFLYPGRTGSSTIFSALSVHPQLSMGETFKPLDNMLREGIQQERNELFDVNTKIPTFEGNFDYDTYRANWPDALNLLDASNGIFILMKSKSIMNMLKSKFDAVKTIMVVRPYNEIMYRLLSYALLSNKFTDEFLKSDRDAIIEHYLNMYGYHALLTDYFNNFEKEDLFICNAHNAQAELADMVSFLNLDVQDLKMNAEDPIAFDPDVDESYYAQLKANCDNSTLIKERAEADVVAIRKDFGIDLGEIL